MKIHAISLGLVIVSVLSACAVVPYSPPYNDYRVYPEYSPYGYQMYQGYPSPYFYPAPIIAPQIIWGGRSGGHWHGHRHDGRQGGKGNWRR